MGSNSSPAMEQAGSSSTRAILPLQTLAEFNGDDNKIPIPLKPTILKISMVDKNFNIPSVASANKLFG